MRVRRQIRPRGAADWGKSLVWGEGIGVNIYIVYRHLERVTTAFALSERRPGVLYYREVSVW